MTVNRVVILKVNWPCVYFPFTVYKVENQRIYEMEW